MVLAKDRSGRVPFSIVAVLILMCGIVTGAYMQQVDRESASGTGPGTADAAGAIVPELRSELESIATRCIRAAVDGQTDIGAGEQDQGLWRVDQYFMACFSAQVREELGSRELGRQGTFVQAGNVTAALTPMPMSIRTVNRLGMTVNMTVPAALRALGSVNFTIIPQGAPGVNRTVDFDVQLASWYPFVLGQLDRMKRDCTDEGLVETLLKEMFRGYLEKCRDDLVAERNSSRRYMPEYGLTVGDFWKKEDLEGPAINAMGLAVCLEEQILFGDSQPMFMAANDGTPDRRFLRVADILEYPGGGVTTYAAFHNDTDGGGMFLDTGLFSNGTRAEPVGTTLLAPASFPLTVDFRWGPDTAPAVTKRSFAGEDGNPDVYMLQVSMNGNYRLAVGPDSMHEVTMDIPVHLEFHEDFCNLEADAGLAEKGDAHCEIEDQGLFDSEYAGLYCTPVSLQLDISNSTGVPARALPGNCSLDILLDGDDLGTFRPADVGPYGLVLDNVPSGPHEICAILTRGDGGEPEEGVVQTVMDGPTQRVRMSTDTGSDTSQFWTCVLEYLRDVPYNLRLVKMLELFSLETGYPIPDEVRSINGNTRENVQTMLNWLSGLDRFFESLDRASECSVAFQFAILKSIRSAVKAIRETLASMEAALDKAGDAAASAADRADGLEASIVFGRTAGAEELTVLVVWDGGETTVAFERPAGSDCWAIAGPEAEAGDEGATGMTALRGFEAAADIAAVVTMAATFYFKIITYRAADGIKSDYERCDLSLEVVKLTVEIVKLAYKYGTMLLADDAAEAAAESTASFCEGMGLVIAVIFLIQSIHDEAQKFRGDPEAWNALLTGLDQDTVMFYFSVAGVALSLVSFLVALGLLTIEAPYLILLWGALALIAVIAMMVFNWQAFSTGVSGVMAGDDKDKMAGSIGQTLSETAGTVAALNDFPSDACMFAARQARGTAFLLGNMAMFTPDMGTSFEMSNLSGYQYDSAWAKEHQARAPRSLRFFLIDMWEQVAELHGHAMDNFDRDQPWDGEILVHETGTGQRYKMDGGYISQFLLGLNSTSVKGFEFGFEVTGNIDMDSFKGWMNELARIGDQLTVQNKQLSRSQAMTAYVSGLDGIRHRDDWGYLQLRMSPSYTSCDVEISSAADFEYYNGRSAQSTTALVQTITRTDGPTGIYLAPGKYTVKLFGQAPGLDLAAEKTSVNVFDLYSPDLCRKTVCILPEPHSIYFQIENRFNGSIRLRADVLDPDDNVVDSLGTVFELDNRTTQSGKEYIDSAWIPGFCFDGSMFGYNDDQRYSLTLRIRFTVELDRGSDGDFERMVSKTIPVNDIRNDQKAVMDKDNGKHNDQLGYRLLVLDQPLKEKIGETGDGQDIVRELYLQWTKVT